MHDRRCEHLLLYRGEDGAVCGVYLRACAGKRRIKVGLPILELPGSSLYYDIIVNADEPDLRGRSKILAILEKYVKDILYEELRLTGS